jgi:hypothetical protein
MEKKYDSGYQKRTKQQDKLQKLNATLAKKKWKVIARISKDVSQN